MELVRESSTRTVGPAEFVPLGDELAEHLKTKGASLANFPGSVPSPAAGSETLGALAALAVAFQPKPAAQVKNTYPSGVRKEVVRVIYDCRSSRRGAELLWEVQAPLLSYML